MTAAAVQFPHTRHGQEKLVHSQLQSGHSNILGHLQNAERTTIVKNTIQNAVYISTYYTPLVLYPS